MYLTYFLPDGIPTHSLPPIFLLILARLCTLLLNLISTICLSTMARRPTLPMPLPHIPIALSRPRVLNAAGQNTLEARLVASHAEGKRSRLVLKSILLLFSLSYRTVHFVVSYDLVPLPSMRIRKNIYLRFNRICTNDIAFFFLCPLPPLPFQLLSCDPYDLNIRNVTV